MIPLIFLLLVSTLMIVDAKSIDDQSRIIGGSRVPLGTYPFMAVYYILSKNETTGKIEESICGGTLITTSHVLTAAHCFNKMIQIKENQVFINTIDNEDLSKGAVTAIVKELRIHEGYDRETQLHDIAIIKLAKPVNGIKPVKLPTSQSANYDGRTATIMGWGQMADGEDAQASQFLMSATLKVLPNNQCKTTDQPMYMFCAASRGRDACQGDSGGPIIVEGVQIGVTSHSVASEDGKSCAVEGQPGLFVRLTKYLSWINKETY